MCLSDQASVRVEAILSGASTLSVINTCKDELRSSFLRRVIPMETLPEEEAQADFPQEGLLSELKRLPDNYRICLYLYYYEGYSAREIGELLHRIRPAGK